VSDALLSSSWYRVAGVRPRLRDHARLHRMRYRGVLWYLLQDPVSNRVHRFTPAARFVIAAMNGTRTVQQLWELTNRQLGEEAPTQDEIIRLLGQLHTADLLLSDATPDATESFERGERQDRSTRRRSYMNPMAIRVHLWDPDALLNRIRPLVDLLWSRWGGLVWLAVVLPALLLLPMQWNELTGNFSDRLLAADNLMMLWLVFPLIKAMHEFGHAAALKRGGGEVHDLGVVMLVLMPIPYVEASASTVFKSKFQRAVVGASGMAVELFIAALAFYAWMLVEPSSLRAILFNVMVVAGVSTLIFNGNPLLRYDAYYILSDLIEMPNLASRSMRYLGYLIERYAFGVTDAQTPEVSAADKVWLATYGVLSSIYRVFVTVAIALFIASEFFIVGVLLALWALSTMAVVPVVKSLHHVFASPRLRLHRRRVLMVSAGFVLILLALLFLVPAPFRTVVQGVAWLPNSAQVRTGHDGFVERLLVTPGTRVQAGERLIEMREPALLSALHVLEAKVAELEASYGNQLVADRSLAAIALDQLNAERTALAAVQQRMETLSVRAQTAGTFMVPKPQDMPERFFRQGELLGYVLDKPQLIVRVVVGQEDVDAVRSATTDVQVRMVHQPDRVLQGQLAREVPGGAEYLPSRALAAEGGGQLATDPRDTQGARTLERTFQFDVAVLTLATDEAPLFFGQHVHVRFEHPPEALAFQWYRSVRRLFLSHFHV
jgi:putative peptide zinc metalloprotease protein